MASKAGSNFFGLFGCESTKTSNGHRHAVTTSAAPTDEPEEGEIVEGPECAGEQGAHFDSLLNDYEHQVEQRLRLKECHKCFICSANLPKYTCPKCGMKTCSLNCCLMHKKNFDCDGVRDQLSFVPLRSYSEHNFSSDCKFLDKTCEAVNSSNRFLNNTSNKDFSNWTNRFIQEAAKRQIRYKKLPALFKRAKENRSLFIYRDKSILWDVEFVFPYCSKDSDDSTQTFYSNTIKKNRLPETSVLGEIIQTLTTNGMSSPKPDSTITEQDDSAHFQMTAYTQCPNDEVVALFKHDSGRFYYTLDLSKSLQQNFAHKTIVEYPTIVVILKSFLTEYAIENATH